MGLAGFEVLARRGGGNVAGGDGVVIISHVGRSGIGELAKGCVWLMKLRAQRSSNR